MTDDINVPGTIIENSPRKRGRPRNDQLHAIAAEFGMTARQFNERQGADLVQLVWPTTADLPVKVMRELGLFFLQDGTAMRYALQVLEMRANGETEQAAALAAALAENMPSISGAIAQTRQWLEAFSPQSVAAQLRKFRLNYSQDSSPRGSREEKEERAVLTLRMTAQQQAFALAGPNEDFQQIARSLLERAATVLRGAKP